MTTKLDAMASVLAMLSKAVGNEEATT